MTETDTTKVADDQSQTDEPKKDEGKGVIYPQIIATLVVNLVLLSCGLCYAWPTVSLLKYQKPDSPIKMKPEEESWVVTAVPLGAIVGPLSAALLVDRIGRKWFIHLLFLPSLIGWILIYLAKDWVLLLVGRLFCGIPTGAAFAVIPQYLGEIVETRKRGAANFMMVIFLNAGYILMYGVGPLVNQQMLAIICTIPPILLFLLVPWLPESPYHCLKKNNAENAELSLIWLRRNINNKDKIDEIKEFIEREKDGGLKKLFAKPVHRKALYIMLLLLAGQQLSGIVAIQSYAGVIIRNINVDVSIHLILLGLGACSLVFGIITSVIIDRVGRKPLYLFSAYTTVLCLAAMGTYYLLEEMRFNVKPYAAVPVAILILFYLAVTVGVTSIPAVVSGEIFPISVKIWASSIINTYGAALALLVSKSYQPILDAFGLKTVFYIFALVELIIATASIFIMPETAKKSFSEIQDELNRSIIARQHSDEELVTEEVPA
nr:facilitated trehalose transporter Tret1-like isoform X2 [Megalopta genalis]XP_033337839.1 facilitated trehalose transporter Tret1-like isoform X2 [Megalopta genalis]